MFLSHTGFVGDFFVDLPEENIALSFFSCIISEGGKQFYYHYLSGCIVSIVPSETIIQLIIATTAIAVVTAAAFYVLRSLRECSLQQEPDTKNHLEYFQELKTEGNITEDEYRNIKKRLSDHIVKELKEQAPSEQSAQSENSEFLAALMAQGTLLRDVERKEGGQSPDDTARWGKSEDGEETKMIGH